MNDVIMSLLNVKNSYSNHGAGVSEKIIMEAEIDLNVKFPNSLREYLLNLGWLDYGPHEFLGLGDLSHDLVATTIKYRKLRRLPVNFVVICDHDGDECVCLDTLKIPEVDNMVIWETSEKKVSRVRARTFFEFLESEIKSFDF